MTDGPAIAIDIALIPSDPVIEAIILINRTINATSGNKTLRLGKETAIPHISMAMGAVLKKDLPAIRTFLDESAAHALPLEIFPDDIVTVTTDAGDRVSGLNVERTARLQELHTTIMRSMEHFFLPRATEEMVAREPGGTVTPFTLDYCTGYPAKAAFERFSPHITLGYGEAGADMHRSVFPCMIRCTALAVCHLGNNCTCERILSRHTA
ncbi:MAG: 2'-5' RNA ligase family protein [Methanomicrobiaceae archaeon]|nr:2'-5' RNA ligase family protein [Methanomicrobiaceae archaeon]